MLKFLPNTVKNQLVEIFNASLEGGGIPNDWKSSLILPILKDNKDPKEAGSYRPIALTSCVAKTLESIMQHRIEWELENSDKLPKTQIGFRKGKGCMENLTLLALNIQKNFQLKLDIVAVFLDIKGAYDHVNIYKLYRYLTETLSSKDIPNLIFKLLYKREAYTLDRSGNSIGPTLLTTGLAQGSPLSPILFNIYTKKIHDSFGGRVKLLQYADDFVLLTEGSNINTLIRLMNNALREISTLFTELDFQVSATKSAAIHFTPRKHDPPRANIVYENNIIEWTKEHKYLGIILTDTMNWTQQISSMSIKANKGINIMKSLTRVWWGADPKTLLMIYNGIVRPHLDYGSQLINPTTKANKEKLNKVQFQALRVVTGCMRSTPTNTLLAESGEMDLEHRRLWLTSKLVLKNIIIEGNPLIELIKDFTNMNTYQGYFARREMPYPVKTLELIDPFLNDLETYQTLPRFKFDRWMQMESVPIINLGILKNEDNINQKFREVIGEKLNSHFIFLH